MRLKFAVVLSVLFLGLLFMYPLKSALAEGETPTVDTVAGCNAVAVDPSMTLEQQQTVCDQAEALPASSCAAAGKGKCSAPKTNDVNVDGHNCFCMDQAAPAETPPPPSGT